MAGRIESLLALGFEAELVLYALSMNDIEVFDPATLASIGRIRERDPTFFLWADTYLLNWLFAVSILL